MSRQAGRVAVVLVPGVGDEGLRETVDAVARALAERPEYDGADVRRIVVSPRPAGDGAGEAASVRPRWVEELLRAVRAAGGKR
jgi:hypothetical protein